MDEKTIIGELYLELRKAKQYLDNITSLISEKDAQIGQLLERVRGLEHECSIRDDSNK